MRSCLVAVIVSARRYNKKSAYCAAAANDAGIRPGTGGCYAPREIAVAAEGQAVWMAWLHYQKERDLLVVTSKKPGCQKAPLIQIDAGKGRVFSTPALLQGVGETPDVICATGQVGDLRINHYRHTQHRWKHLHSLPTVCASVHCVDCTYDGCCAYLAYAGVRKGFAGLTVFSRTFRNGRWSKELPHTYGSNSLNRPGLAVSGSGGVVLVCDCYDSDGFSIVWKMLNDQCRSQWRHVQRDKTADQLCPALVTDASGIVWLSWLHQKQVCRDEVAGLSQEAQVARLTGSTWKLAPDDQGIPPGNLNLGLLPLKRYFGYDGLRRRPRVAALTDGTVALLWEQQKDEKEIWTNVDNGYFCARRFDGRKWAPTIVLFGEGCCHCFDARHVYDPAALPLAYKGRHRRSGNDFEVTLLDMANTLPVRMPQRTRWNTWEECDFARVNRTRASESGNLAKSTGLDLYWGDLHCHGVFSPDAEGASDELFFFARSKAGLDFCAVTDNDCYPPKALLNSEVSHTCAIADALTENGRFLAFGGYEYTYHQPDEAGSFNHRIVIFHDEDHTVIGRHQRDGVYDQRFVRRQRNSSQLIFPHHRNWTLLGLPGEAVVEITSGWGPYILDAPTIHDNLNAGAKFGFIGNGDSHRFMPGLTGGLTGVYARELTRAAIIEAVKARRCFATTGNKTAVAFWINDSFMGSDIIADAELVLRWRVQPWREIERIEIVYRGQVIHRTQKCRGQWTCENSPEPNSWYYLRVKEKGRQKRYPHNVAPAWGKWAWSSPIWVRGGYPHRGVQKP